MPELAWWSSLLASVVFERDQALEAAADLRHVLQEVERVLSVDRVMPDELGGIPGTVRRILAHTRWMEQA